MPEFGGRFDGGGGDVAADDEESKCVCDNGNDVIIIFVGCKTTLSTEPYSSELCAWLFDRVCFVFFFLCSVLLLSFHKMNDL